MNAMANPDKSAAATTNAAANARTYRIRTLADLWALESADQIERAFREISAGMLHARRLQDEVLAGAASDLQAATGVSATDQAICWPETVIWVDDSLERLVIGLTDEKSGQRTVMVNTGAADVSDRQ